MRYRQITLRELSVDGALVDTVRAALTIRQDEPVEGVFGLPSWSISATIRGYPNLATDAALEARSSLGRTCSGRAIITRSSESGQGTVLQIDGAGALDGFDELVDFG